MYTVIFVLGLCSAAYAHIVYQTKIPNGDSVPDPCSSGIWGPVGHYNAQRHTTAKNPFGLVSVIIFIIMHLLYGYDFYIDCLFRLTGMRVVFIVG